VAGVAVMPAHTVTRPESAMLVMSVTSGATGVHQSVLLIH
jgi:hypothetical protein